MKTRPGTIWIFALVLWSSTLSAVEYRCDVKQKLFFSGSGTAEREIKVHMTTPEDLEKYQFHLLVVDTEDKTIVSRCSFTPSAGKITCDPYTPDEVMRDPFVKIKKYYYFAGQFDLQIFANMTFVENNGRGGIAFGRCEATAP